jgi:hypothetical protein
MTDGIAAISITRVIYPPGIGAPILRSTGETRVAQLPGVFPVLALPLFISLGHLLPD